VTNTAATPQTLSGTTGASPGFSVTDDCDGATLAAGASCTMSIAFAPGATGEQTGVIAGSWNGVGHSVFVHGRGIAAGTTTQRKYLITPTAFDFGDVLVGARSVEQTTSFTNLGGDDMSTARPTVDTPVNGTTVTRPVTVAGTGLPAANIEIRQGTLVVAGTTVDAAGNYSATIDRGTGIYDLHVSQTFDNEVFSASTDVTVTVPTPPPPPVANPVFTAPTPGSVLGESTVTFRGTGQPFSLVFLGEQPGVALGSGSVAADGTWQIAITLPDGHHTMGGIQFSAGGVQRSLPLLSFTVDTTAPSLVVPSVVVADATGPAGVALSLPVSAVDLIDGAITPSCTPPTGATFAIGTTQVTCTATDHGGNVATASFDVVVHGAAAQLEDAGSYATSIGAGPIASKIGVAGDSLARGNTTAARNQIDAALKQVAAQAGKSLTAAQAAELTAELTRIRAVIG
jgi:hypothetical protein